MKKIVLNKYCKFLFGGLFLPFALMLISVESAEAEARSRRPTVRVHAKVTVNKQTITLADIARISAAAKSDTALVEKLKSIYLADAPPPKSSATILGVKVLSAIEDAGVALDSIGYSIPKTITVLTVGRKVEPAEVLEAVRSSFQADTPENLRIRQVRWDHDYIIPQGKTQIKADRLAAPTGGKLPIRVEVFVNNISEARFLATAHVDFWQDIPVATRSLDRGMLIRPDDIQMVRINVSSLSDDVVRSAEELIGRRLKNQIRPGETIRRRTIDIPPTIVRGSIVTMIYSHGALTATALGRALDDALLGEELRVQNVDSRKVIRAKVVSPYEVKVRTP